MDLQGAHERHSTFGKHAHESACVYTKNITYSMEIQIYIHIYSSSSTLAGLSYHICGKLEVAFKGSPSSQHQHCTDEAQKAATVLSAVTYIYI